MVETELSRKEIANAFLESFFQSTPYELTKMRGDASNREYYRIHHEDKSYIMMDCPPEYTSVEPFLNIGGYLSETGLRAPEIYSENVESGFLILEDFGTKSAKDHIESLSSPKEVEEFYKVTIDALCNLQEATPPEGLNEFSDELIITELDVFLDWYIQCLEADGANIFRRIWFRLLKKRPTFEKTIVLRDYHVENIMMVQGKDPNTIEALGMLDFQDALLGSPIYDLVSILEDARIDVDRNMALNLIQYYADKKGYDFDDVLLEYSILGLQRNLRILGVFARKFKRDGAAQYMNFMSRVLDYVSHDLSVASKYDCPELAEIKKWMKRNKVL